MKSLAIRLERLAKRRSPSLVPELTPAQRREWCIKLGVDPDSVLLGRPGGFVILPPEVSE